MSADEIIDKYQVKIKILSVCVLIFSLGFACGYYYLSENKSGAEVAIEDKSADCSALFERNARVAVVSTVTASNSQNETAQDSAGMVLSETISGAEVVEHQFAASKNSTLYHTRNCQYVKRIKPENLVWFNSAAEAEAAGKTAHSCVDE
ncbi:MAG: hypothetical protein PHX30_00905 [Candidatus Pacebacteria bacterium]|jgi:hypothetical protein|nr:hypothetical protein [Candidatus Paceibacterota bacterium]